MENSEQLQVANYGLGGYYAPHYDYGRVRMNPLNVLPTEFSPCPRVSDTPS